MTERARIGRTLVAAMREDAAAAREWAGSVSPDRLVRAARFHGATGFLHSALRGVSGDPVLTELVTTAYHLGLGVTMRAMADLAEVARMLDDKGIEWLIVKGPALGERLYPEPGLRSYNDLDLVVPAASFPRAVGALDPAGTRTVDRNWRLLHEEMRGQIRLVLPYGTLADLHWHLINRDRAPFAIRMDEIFARSRPVQVAELALRTTDPIDTLLHVCLHAYLGGGNRLGWMKDIQRSIAVEPPEWREVAARARAWRIEHPVAAMLVRARRTLDVSLPEDVPASFGPGVRGFLDRLAAGVLPMERSSSARSAAALPARLLARRPAASAAVYGRRFAARLRLGPSHAGDPVLLSAGDEADRRAFLDGIEKAGYRRF